MRHLLLVSILLLSGCATTAVPVTVKFPTAPETLIEDCPPLNTLPEGAKLSDLMRTDVKNMVQYHECSRKNKGWVEWYNQQKQIFEQATSK
jgi:hypothetical protein